MSERVCYTPVPTGNAYIENQKHRVLLQCLDAFAVYFVEARIIRNSLQNTRVHPDMIPQFVLRTHLAMVLAFNVRVTGAVNEDYHAVFDQLWIVLLKACNEFIENIRFFEVYLGAFISATLICDTLCFVKSDVFSELL